MYIGRRCLGFLFLFSFAAKFHAFTADVSGVLMVFFSSSSNPIRKWTFKRFKYLIALRFIIVCLVVIRVLNEFTRRCCGVE